MHVKLASHVLRRHVEYQAERCLLAVLHSRMIEEYASADKVENEGITLCRAAEGKARDLMARVDCSRQLSCAGVWHSNKLEALKETVIEQCGELSIAVVIFKLGYHDHEIRSA